MNKAISIGVCVSLLVFIYIVFGKLPQHVPAPTPPPPVVQPRVEPIKPAVRLGVEHVIKLNKGERSEPIRVYGTECIRDWSKTPDEHTYDILLRGVNEEGWYPWKVWNAGGAPFKAPGWFVYEALKDGVEVNYVILKARSCGEKRP